MFTGEQDFLCRSTRLTYDRGQASIRLSRNDRLRLADCDKQQAEQLLLNHQPALSDANHQLAWISIDGKSLLTGNVIDDASAEPVRVSAIEAVAESMEMLELQPVTTTGDTRFTDLAMWDRSIALSWSDNVERHGVDVIELGSKRHYGINTLENVPEKIWIDRQKRIWIFLNRFWL